MAGINFFPSFAQHSVSSNPITPTEIKTNNAIESPKAVTKLEKTPPTDNNSGENQSFDSIIKTPKNSVLGKDVIMMIPKDF